MADFRVLGVGHTSFTVSDIERSVAMFRQLLGFELVDQAYGVPAVTESLTGIAGAQIKLAFLCAPDGHVIELIQYVTLGQYVRPAPGGRVEARPCDPGFAHIALNVDDLDAAVRAARAMGLELYNRIAALATEGAEGARAAYLKDWDGVTIEFMEWPDAAPALLRRRRAHRPDAVS